MEFVAFIGNKVVVFSNIGLQCSRVWVVCFGQMNLQSNDKSALQYQRTTMEHA